MTGINRKSYMAEVSSLLALITDDRTRAALIQQMENMFDAAPDENRLMQEIGSPTKVAVSLIRFAESGRVRLQEEPEPEVVQTLGASMPEPAAEPEPAPGPEPQDAPADVLEDDFEAPEEALPDDSFDTDFVDDFEQAFAERMERTQVLRRPAAAAEPARREDEAAPRGEGPYADDDPFRAMFEPEEPEEPELRTNVPLAVLYTIGAILAGTPVFAALLALNLGFLALGIFAVAAGAALFATAFIGFSVVADMLLLIGSGTSILALALVLVWFAVWFFLRVTLGWIRALVRLGRRWCCREVEAA